MGKQHPKVHSVDLPLREEVRQEKERLRRKQYFFRSVRSTIGFLLVIAAISVLIATQFLPVVQISGDSMEPSLSDGEIVILQKTSDFETGDVVAFYYQSKLLIKRVIGQAGDYIDMDTEGNVYVNGELINEPYVTDKSLGDCEITFPYQVPDGRIFVLGDHRSVSLDSRSRAIGCVSQEQIMGKVIFRVWPPRQAGIL